MAKHSQWSDFDTTDDYCSMDTEPCKIIVSHTGAYILLSLHHFSAAHGTGLSRSLKVFTVYPCLLHLLMPSPSTHAFSVYSCLHHLPMPSPSIHAFTIYPCFLCPPMPSLSTHAFSCPFEYVFFSVRSQNEGE
jgi:hypothetical protein